jgi:hypothetical protein
MHLYFIINVDAVYIVYTFNEFDLIVSQ